MALNKILFSENINSEALMALINDEIYILAIKNFVNYKNLDEICEKIEKTPKDYYEYEKNIVSHLGQSSYEIDNEPVRFENYYKNVQNNNINLKNLFNPYETPVDFFIKKGNIFWKEGICVDKFHNQQMFAGIIRVIHKDSAIHAHQDLVTWSNSNATSKNEIKKQFGANIFLKVPRQGGELYMWDKELSYEEFQEKSKGIFCIPMEELPKPDFVVKPAPGMLILLNSHKLHAIARSEDDNRIALSFFMAYRGIGKPLTIWS